MELLTVKDLAKRWKVTETTIYKYLEDGIITKIQSIPTVRFNVNYIEEIEQQGDNIETAKEKMLKRKIEQLEHRNAQLESRIKETIKYFNEVI